MIIGLSGYLGSGKDTVGKMIQYLTPTDLYLKPKIESYKDFCETYDLSGVKFGPNMLIPHSWQIKKFAGKLKQIASMLTEIPVENFEDQEFKKQPLDRNWTYETDVPGYGKQWVEMTVREFLQKLGTEAIRDGLHQNAWVNALFADYKPVIYKIADLIVDSSQEKDKYPNWIITDTRFPNEAEAIKARGGVVVRVERGFDDLDLGPIQMRIQRDPSTLHASETGLDDWKFDYVINNNGTLEELQEAVKTLLINMEN